MRNNRMMRVLKITVFVILAGVAFSFAVMGLWNWLTPAIFGWHRIDVWQALGLLVLCKLLFGGFRGGWRGRGGHWRRRMMERWEQMSPEEREKFRQGLRGRCGSFEPPATEPKV